MLIDDDEDDIFFFRETLHRIDPTLACKIFSDGNKAFEFLQQNEFPSLVFLDINMPKINGLELLKKFRNDPRLKDLNVVIFSTTITADQAAFFASMKTPYMEKGITMKEWEKIIKAQLAALRNGR